MYRCFIAIVLAILLCMQASSPSPVSAQADTTRAVINVEIPPHGNPRITTPGNSQVGQNWTEYQDLVSQVDFGSERTPELRVNMHGNTSTPGTGMLNPRTNVWNYTLNFGMGSEFVGSCISKQLRHVELEIKDGSRQVAMLHMCAWRDGAGLQLGVLNTKNGWCWRSNINWPRVWQSIFDAAVSAGISKIFASMMADVGTPIVLPVLLALA